MGAAAEWSFGHVSLLATAVWSDPGRMVHPFGSRFTRRAHFESIVIFVLPPAKRFSLRSRLYPPPFPLLPLQRDQLSLCADRA